MPDINLPDAEMEVLACLRRLGESTARQLREELEAQRPMAHGSMATLLKRLEDKGLVARKKGPVGKAFVYRPTRQGAAACASRVRAMVQRLFGGSGASLVASLFETNPPNAEEVEQLQSLLNELREKNRKTGGRK